MVDGFVVCRDWEVRMEDVSLRTKAREPEVRLESSISALCEAVSQSVLCAVGGSECEAAMTRFTFEFRACLCVLHLMCPSIKLTW